MSYDKEIAQKLGKKTDAVGNIYKISIAKDYAVVEGHKGVLYFGDDKIILKLKSGNATLLGQSLSIVSSQRGEIVIKGRVTRVDIGEEKK